MLPNITDVVVMRVLIRHGFTRDMADMLLQDIERSIDYLKKHPPGNTAGRRRRHHVYASRSAEGPLARAAGKRPAVVRCSARACALGALEKVR